LCHVGPNPIRPPADPNNPEWGNLSSNVGAQYFWTDRIFYEAATYSSFAFQLFHSSRPGSLDTSFVSTDNINNPRTMNAVYALLPRLLNARRWGQESLAGGGRDNKQFNDYVKDGPLAGLFTAPETVLTPRVLKDGADSVGAMGALNRVYLNIGAFSEEWLTHFNALVGGKPITPITIADARKNSAYYAATEAQTFDMARFFLRTTEPHHLADAPGGAAYLTTDQRVMTRGKEVFAENCARCHSSKLPEKVAGLDPNGCTGGNYLSCWNAYWEATETPAFKAEMRRIVTAPDFLDGNYLSAEFRVPVTLLQTNACSPLATNALAGNIWDNFSSQSYKDLPSVGDITWYHPYTGEPRTYTMPAGGRGYTRPPSLISAWSTAPFLLNNTVGRFEPSPSVEARMRAFDDAIHQMLWPERRDKDSLLGATIPGVIDRVGDRAPAGYRGEPAYVTVPLGYLPEFIQKTLGAQKQLFPALFTDEGVRLGPIPQGAPIGLLANLNLLSEDRDPVSRARHAERIGTVLVQILERLHRLGGNATSEQARAAFSDLVDPLLELSKCPDLVVNRGHLFGTTLPDADKNALIEFLKTF
jgi:mono/diheme cytochrome c family protein